MAPELAQAPSTTFVPYVSTATPARRALSQRRALWQTQASQVTLSRRWAAAAVASPQRLQQLAELRGQLIAARRFQLTQQHQYQQQQPNRTPFIATASFLPTTSAIAPAAAVGPAPDVYLNALLSQRGRTALKVNSVEAGYQHSPTAQQVADYEAQPHLSGLARRGDMEGLQKAVDAGRGMDACNKFGESVVHIACRRGDLALLRFLVANGGSLTACDDLGRFPLHEVCWAAEPRFDIVRMFLEEERGANTRRRRRASSSSSSSSNASTVSGCSSYSGGGSDGSSAGSNTAASSDNENDDRDSGGGGDLNMLLVTDNRGYSPLRYVKKELWPQWRSFLDEVVDEYWPSLSPESLP